VAYASLSFSPLDRFCAFASNTCSLSHQNNTILPTPKSHPQKMTEQIEINKLHKFQRFGDYCLVKKYPEYHKVWSAFAIRHTNTPAILAKKV